MKRTFIVITLLSLCGFRIPLGAFAALAFATPAPAAAAAATTSWHATHTKRCAEFGRCPKRTPNLLRIGNDWLQIGDENTTIPMSSKSSSSRSSSSKSSPIMLAATNSSNPGGCHENTH
jgi:hypothetical protein